MADKIPDAVGKGQTKRAMGTQALPAEAAAINPFKGVSGWFRKHSLFLQCGVVASIWWFYLKPLYDDKQRRFHNKSIMFGRKQLEEGRELWR